MDGEPPQEEDFSQIPIVERSQHKVCSQKRLLEAWLTYSELESSFISLHRCHCQISKDSI
jgi:hypothetical protein